MTKPNQTKPNLPLLAVIVPIYNVETYLSKCLDSIINQTYQNLWIICVNDGSPDNCGTILDLYSKKDSRITVIQKKNGGISSARNFALDFIRTSYNKGEKQLPEYISFIDPDDYIDICAYENLLSKFNEDIDIVAFGYKTIKEFNGCLCVDETHLACSDGGLGKQTIKDSLIQCINVTVWNKLYRYSIIEYYRIRFPLGVVHEDQYFIAVYLFHCKKIWLDNSYYYNYLIRNDSLSQNARLKRSGLSLDLMEISNALLLYLKDNDLLKIRSECFLNLFYEKVWTALSLDYDNVDTPLIYDLAIKILDEVKMPRETFLSRRKEQLIRKRAFCECTKYVFFRIFKHKQRINYDKYYFIGCPILKVEYNEKSKILTLIGFIKISKLIKT